MCGRIRLASRWAIFGSLGPYEPLHDVMVVVYGGHGERGPEGRVMTFVLPFVAAVLIFDETMTRNLGGSVAVRGGELVEAEAHGV